MHVFQPYPMEMLDWNPMEKISKEWFALVSEANGRINAMTASWGGIGHLWGKNVVFVFIRESRFSKELVDNSDFFSINFLDPKDSTSKMTLKYLGAASGRNEDKLAQAKLSVNDAYVAPILDDANFALTCQKIAAVELTADTFIDPEILPAWYKDGDFHTMYVGEILEVLAR